MPKDLRPGLQFTQEFRVPPDKTVPHLYPEAEEFQDMPEVFATGFMVGLIEWACLRAVKPYLDWPREQTVGTHVDLSHLAATPPGLTVRVAGSLAEVEGRRLVFWVQAFDDHDLISEGTHVRAVIDVERFNRKAQAKLGRTRG